MNYFNTPNSHTNSPLSTLANVSQKHATKCLKPAWPDVPAKNITPLFERVKAKFHYTGPTGPARTQRSFSETRAAKKSVRVRSGRARVVEFSYNLAWWIWGIDLVNDVRCEPCDDLQRVDAPLGVAFTMPNPDSLGRLTLFSVKRAVLHRNRWFWVCFAASVCLFCCCCWGVSITGSSNLVIEFTLSIFL